MEKKQKKEKIENNFYMAWETKCKWLLNILWFQLVMIWLDQCIECALDVWFDPVRSFHHIKLQYNREVKSLCIASYGGRGKREKIHKFRKLKKMVGRVHETYYLTYMTYTWIRCYSSRKLIFSL